MSGHLIVGAVLALASALPLALKWQLGVKKLEMIFNNERVTTLIDAEDLQIAIVQIAPRLVRRIVTFVSEGGTMLPGQRIGAIRFGSQVDFLIRAEKEINLSVQEGDRVVAGRTIMAVVTTWFDDAVSPALLSGNKVHDETAENGDPHFLAVPRKIPFGQHAGALDGDA